MIGKTISHYKILDKLGAGGMGVVYKAEDTTLGRVVALKFLPPELTRDKKAGARLIQEARAASTMDHPNICTIYEVGETQDGQIFISMAFYPGKTLKEKLGEGAMSLTEALATAEQIARGLAVAHARGIVHRDIKPGNIFVLSDGQVKIVDFGLAKLAGQLKLTTTGRTMGTVLYMSPELGRGEEAGPASDVWALGVILYEMVTGELPFKGDYDAAVMYSAMHEDPAPLGTLRPEVPDALEYIIGKALAKKEAERYRDAGELASDLGVLRQQLGRDQPARRETWRFRRGKRSLSLVIGAAAIVAAVLAVVWQTSVNRQRHPGPVQGSPRQITSGDFRQDEPAISPDGTRIAFTSDASGNNDIWVIGIRSGNPERLTSEPSVDFYPAWFADGTAIAFVSDRGGKEGIWKMDQMGGGATLLIADAIEPALSPDGKRIAFSIVGPSKRLRIGVAPLADPARTTLLTGDGDGLWHHRCPAWSPDGQAICYATQNDLWTVPSSGGTARQLTKGGAGDTDPMWTTDGKHVLFSSHREGTLALWRVGATGGTPERFTWGTGYDHDPSVCADGSRLAYATRTTHTGLRVRNLSTGKEAMLEGRWDEYMAAISPDGSQVVFASARSGRDVDLWSQPLADGLPAGDLRRLTDEVGYTAHPTFSPDGKWLAYYLVRGDERDIYTLPASGGQPIRFTEDPANDIQPVWSPDGGKIAFVSEREGGFSVYVAPVEDGRPAGPAKRMTAKEISATAPSWSPDGAFIAFTSFKPGQSEVWIVPADGRGAAKQITTGAMASRTKWDSSTGSLIVSGTWGQGTMTLRRVSPGTGASTPIVPPVIFGLEFAPALFDVSAAGRLVVYSRSEYSGNIWLFETKKGVF
jgi:Tol biopolymer transport system component